MVATDIAARGIHVDGIDLVIHADPRPSTRPTWHRSGRRTACNGADGAVVTVQTAAQAAEVRILMRKAGVTLQAATVGPGSAVLHFDRGPGQAHRPGDQARQDPGRGQCPGPPAAAPLPRPEASGVAAGADGAEGPARLGSWPSRTPVRSPGFESKAG